MGGRPIQSGAHETVRPEFQEVLSDDATLVRRIVEGRDAESALSELMERHAPKVTGHLRQRFQHTLQHADIDEAVNEAAMKVWNNAHRFDTTKAFGPWFLCIAHRAALRILKGEKEQPDELSFEPQVDQPKDLPRSPRMKKVVEQLEHFIEHKLRGFEQALARADLAAGGRADTGLLMEQHQKKKSVVEVTRSKVWKKIRESAIGASLSKVNP